jgi:hypothetical protein
VKVGDLVKLVKVSTAGQVGIVLSNPHRLHGVDRFDLLMDDGKIVKGLPRPYMEVISEAR